MGGKPTGCVSPLRPVRGRAARSTIVKPQGWLAGKTPPHDWGSISPAVAFALRRSRSRGLKQELSEAERYAVANHEEARLPVASEAPTASAPMI